MKLNKDIPRLIPVLTEYNILIPFETLTKGSDKLILVSRINQLGVKEMKICGWFRAKILFQRNKTKGRRTNSIGNLHCL